MSSKIATPKDKRKRARLSLVLEYYDGPQAVLLQRSDDCRIVAVAADVSGYQMPFFGAEINLSQWERYRRGFVDLRYLFVHPHFKRWYFFDLIDARDRIALNDADLSDGIQNDLIPEHGFFSYNHSEPVDIDIKQGRAIQSYKTDGVWDIGDFTKFYNKFSDLYAFFLSFKKYADQSISVATRKKIRDAFAKQPLRGGSSYGNLYNELAFSQNDSDRIAIGRIKYASPGEIEVRGRFDVFTEVSVAFHELEAHYIEIKDQYTILYKYLQEQGLLRAEAERFDQEGPIALYLKEMADKLGDSLKLADLSLLFDLTNKNALLYSKVLLAHFRRMEKYFLFFAEGRVKDPVTATGS